MKIRQAFATTILAALPVLSGCLSHTHIVPKTRPADVILGASLDQLLKRIDDQYAAIQTMTATVDIVASTGGSLKGQVTDYLSVSGYIIIGKPEQIRVLLKAPVVGTRVLDMVSDGKTFKLLISIQNRAVTGSNTVTTPSKNGLENLRPGAILDSMLVQGVSSDHIVSLTQDIRVYENPRKKNDLIEEPDYDIEFLSQPHGSLARTLRVIHISRGNLLPYQQDIYNDEGKVATRAFYTDYQTFNEIPFPSRIVIKRPLDQYSLAITITKVDFNKPLDPDQFELKIPDNVPTQKMP